MTTITVKFIGRETPISIQFGSGAVNTNNTGIIHTQHHIFLDDTILTIKQKILDALQGSIPEDVFSNDLYLFATVYKREPDPTQWVQQIQQHPVIQRQVLYKQVLSNLGYTKADIEEKSIPIPEPNTLLDFHQWNVHQKRIPLGIRPEKGHTTDFFPVHPLETYTYDGLEAPIEWSSHQNEVLLEYGDLTEPVIYACLYRDIPDEHRAQYGMTNRAVKTLPAIRRIWQKQEQILAVSKWAQTQPPRKVNSGITLLEMEWIHPHYAVLPLEIIFKNIHAYNEVPFIKWNTLYRVHCPTKDERGNKVPVLSKEKITKIDRDNINTHLTLWTQQGVTLYILKNGNLQVRVQSKTPLPPKQIQENIKNVVGPILRQINDYLQKTGFSFPLNWIVKEEDIFRNDPTTLKIRNIQWSYSTRIQMDTATALKKEQLDYLDPAFVVLSVDNEKRISQAHLNYRRVSNYDTLNELKDIIRFEFTKKNTEKIGKVAMKRLVEDLEKRGYPTRRIQETTQEVLEEIQAGKQPFHKKEKRFGCPLLLEQKYDEIQFTLDNIPFVQNIDLLRTYLEAFIQFAFYSDSLPKSLEFPAIIGFAEMDEVEEEPETEPVEEGNVLVENPTDLEENNLIENEATLLDNEKEEEKAEQNLEAEDEEDETTGILLYDEDDEDVGEMKDILQFNIPDVEESPSFMAGGAKKANASFSILNRLTERDPKIFKVPDKNGKVYSRICPGSSSRYPIVLSKEEKTRIDKKDEKLQQTSYTDPLEYNNNIYVCPRYWNFRENRSMSQAEFDNNPELKQHLIVDEKDKNNDANDRYIYEFKKGKRIDKNNQYKEHVPGFSSKNKDGFCLPCCFSEKDATFHKNIRECQSKPIAAEEPAAKQAAKKRKTVQIEEPPEIEVEDEETEKEEKIEEENPVEEAQQGELEQIQSATATAAVGSKVANAKYILGINIYPLEAKRWGHIPPPIQGVMKSPLNPSSGILLRYGVERKENQSFFACFADLLGRTVEETKEYLTTQVLTLDKFIQYQTGAVVSRFSLNQQVAPLEEEPDTEEFQNTQFYKSLDLENPDEYQFLLETIKTYKRFLNYLKQDGVVIDPTYLWDVISTPDENLFITGMNIIIFEMDSNEDTQITVTCPANLYSNTDFYDETKPTWLLIKRTLLTGENYYEPIYHALLKNGVRGANLKEKFFLDEFLAPLFPFLKTLDKNACFSKTPSSQTSDELTPRKATAEYVANVLKKKRFLLLQQVVNRYGKTVGLMVEKKPVITGVFVPCFPSVSLPDIERLRLAKQPLQKSLASTTENLQYIEEQTGLPCSVKTWVASFGENPQVVGVKNGYQGYSPVIPENLPTEKTIPVEYSSDPIDAEMATRDPVDEDDPSQMYFLEKEFFLAFQGKMRNLLNEYANESVRQKIIRLSNYKTTQQQGNEKKATFTERFKRVLELLKQVAEGKVIFNDFDKRVLLKIKNVFACQTDVAQQAEPQPYCVLRNSGSQDGQDKMIFPKRNLVNPAEDNEQQYFSKLADALVRNSRIQNIVFQPFRFFNLLGSVDYQIDEDELLLGIGA